MPRDVNTAFEYQRNDSGLEGQKSLIGQILADWNGISMIYRHALLLRDYIEGMYFDYLLFYYEMEFRVFSATKIL